MPANSTLQDTPEARALVAAKLAGRITTNALDVVAAARSLGPLVDAFSTRHSETLYEALLPLSAAIEDLIPDLRAVIDDPMSWDRDK